MSNGFVGLSLTRSVALIGKGVGEAGGVGEIEKA
jgi:hypothetical protein